MRPLESAMVITGNPEKTTSYRQETMTPRTIGTGLHRYSSWRTGRLAVNGSAHTLDPRPELRELLLDALVTAVEMVDAVHRRRPARNQTREHQARRSA